MIATALLALGLVMVVEGLVYALAPGLVEDMLEAMRAMPVETRRALGLGVLAAGVVVLWISHALGA